MTAEAVERTLWESVLSIVDRKFSGTDPLPLPSYVFYLLNPTCIYQVHVSICLFLFIISGMVALGIVVSQQPAGQSLFIFCLCMLSFSLLYIFSALSNAFFLLCLFNTTLYTICREYSWISALLMGVLMASDSSAIPLVMLVRIRAVCSVYRLAADGKVPIRRVLKALLCSMVKWVVIPLIIYYSSLLANLAIKTEWSEDASNYSLLLQAQLRGFSINGKLNSQLETHSHEDPEHTGTHSYVMDRSFISIMNHRHRGFILQTVDTEAAEGVRERHAQRYFEIQKVHAEQFEEEEPRYIKNGDVIKLVGLDGTTAMGIREPEVKIINKKLMDVTFEEFSESENLWEVACEGYLKIRDTPAEFIHQKRRIPLGCSRLKNDLYLYASSQIERKSRIFYIVENKNHPYYLESFQDRRAEEETVSFPPLSLYQRFKEYCGSVSYKFYPSQLFTADTLKLLTGIPKILPAHAAPVISWLIIIPCLLLSLLFAAVVFAFHVLNARYSYSLKIPEFTRFLLFLFLTELSCFPVFRGSCCPLLYTSILFNLSFISSLFSGRPVTLEATGYKIKRE